MDPLNPQLPDGVDDEEYKRIRKLMRASVLRVWRGKHGHCQGTSSDKEMRRTSSLRPARRVDRPGLPITGANDQTPRPDGPILHGYPLPPDVLDASRLPGREDGT